MAEHLSEVLRFWSRRFTDELAVRISDRDISWRELDRAADEIAAGLADRGVTRGDVVGILMSNRPEFVEAMHGVFRAGAIVELLNTRFTAAEMVHPVVDSGTRLVITESAAAGALADAVAAVPGLRIISVDPLDGSELLGEVRLVGSTPPPVEYSAEDIALLTYTSGTTGTPKGAMLSHRAVISNGNARAVADGITWRDRILVTIPLAYTGGCGTYLREAVCTGAPAIIEPTFDPPRVLHLLEKERITCCSSVPVVWQSLLSLPDFGTADLSSLRACIGAGAVVPIEVIKAYQAIGVGMRQGYGQTEIGGGYATLLYEHEADTKIGSVGRPILHHEARVVDEDDQDVPVGEPGQILLRGPSVMSGYWNRPEETAETLAGGWLHTGDIGTLDEDGYLRLVDRTKDMLISGGLNVYPAEIEKVLGGLAGLGECAVVGVPDERWGEVPMMVVPDLSGIDVEVLKSEMAGRLADYKRPKWIVAHGRPLPRTLSGKILKRELRAGIDAVPADAKLLK